MEFSRHAIDQMQRRGISTDLVNTGLQQPVHKTVVGNLTIFHYFYKIDGKDYLLRIFVNEKADPHKVVTVYRTSKIGKYHEGKI